MTVDELVRLVTTVGFPSAVTIYVLVRLERRMEALTQALHELRVCLARQERRELAREAREAAGPAPAGP